MVDVLQITEMAGKYYISSLSVKMNGKYLIECTSQSNAKTVRQKLQSRSLPLPIESNRAYEKISVFNCTPIYRVKQVG